MTKAAPSSRSALRASSLLAGAVISLSLLVGAGTAAAQTLPTLQIAREASPITEGADAVFNITISTAQTVAVVLSVKVEQVNKPLPAGTTLPTSVTIPASSTIVQLRVATEDDSRDEMRGRITAQIYNPDTSKYTLGPDFEQIFVQDNDEEPTMSITGATVLGGSPLRFIVSIDAVSDQQIAVSFRTSDGTAKTADSDYTATSGRLQFSAGETAKTVEVVTQAGTTAHAPKTVFLVLSLESNTTLGMTMASGTIVAVPVIDISTYRSATPSPVTEGSMAEIELAASLVPSQNLTVQLQLTSKSGDYLAIAMVDPTTNRTTYTSATMTTHDVVFAAGASTATFQLGDAIHDDSVDEPDGEVELKILGSTKADGDPATDDYFVASGGADGKSSVTIAVQSSDRVQLDHDAPQFIGQEGGNVEFALTLIGGTVYTIRVDYETSNGSAMAGTDYTRASGTLTFLPTGSMGEDGKRTITVMTIADSMTETGGEDFHLLLSVTAYTAAGSNGLLSLIQPFDRRGFHEVSIAGTISELPVLSVALDADNVSVTELDTPVFTISNTQAGARPLTLTVTVTEDKRTASTDPGVALAGDVHSLTAEVTIPAGQASTKFSFSFDDDNRRDVFTGYAVTIENPDTDAFTLNPEASTALISVADTDDSPTVNVSSPEVFEGEDLLFEVRLTGQADISIWFNYTTSAGTAMPGDDYTATSGSLTFMPRELVKTITVSTKADSTQETVGETLHLLLSGLTETGTGIRGGEAAFSNGKEDHMVTGTIKDKPVLSLSFSPPLSGFIYEHEEASFTVSIDPEQAKEVVVPVTLSDISNFLLGPPPSSVTIPANTSSALLVLAFEDDDRTDQSRALTVTISNPDPTAYTLANASIDGITIGDSKNMNVGGVMGDDEETVNITDAPDAAEGDSMRFLVTLTDETDQLVTVSYMTSDGTATVADKDYTSTTGILTFDLRETVKTIAVPVLADSAEDAGEKLNVHLFFDSGQGGATLGRSVAVGTIVELPILSLIQNNTNTARNVYNERDTAVFTISITEVQSQPVVVPVTVTEGSGGVSLAGNHPTSVTLPANESSVMFSFNFDDDMRRDAQGLHRISIGSPDASRYGVATSATSFPIIVLDPDDPSPTISVSNPPQAAEGTRLMFEVRLSIESDLTITVDYTTEDGTTAGRVAIAGQDYTATSGTLTFRPRETVKTVFVEALQDNVDEMNQPAEVRLVLSGASEPATTTHNTNPPVSIATAEATGTIIELPVLSIAADNASVVESAAGGAVFTISMTPAQTAEVAVPVTVTQTGSFLAGTPSGSVTIPANGSSVKLTIALDNDARDEADGSITVTLRSPDATAYAVGMASATVTVTDDDDAPTISVKAAEAREGEPLLFLVSLSAASGRTVSVSYTTEDGTAIAGVDYEATSGNLTFQPDVAALTVAVATMQDTIDDSDETMYLALAAPSNASLDMQAGTHRATGTIVEGLNEEEMRQLNEAILPYVASALGNVTSRALQDRTKVALSGNSPRGLSVRGSSLSQFLVAQAKTGSDPALFNRGLSQAPGIHPAAVDAALPYTALDQWQAQADARAAAGSHNHPRLGVGDLDFTMALSGGQQGRQSADGSLNLWGSGYYTDFANDDSDMPFDGKVTGGMIGIDMLYAGWLMGVAVNRTETDVDWRYKDFTGSHEITLTGFHPYFARQLDEHTRVWFTLGHEQGEAEITEDGRAGLCSFCKFDVTMTSAALGVSSRLHETATENGTARVNFIADGSYSHIKGDTRQAVTAAASWLRLGLELDYQRALTGNSHLGGSVELVMRSDFEDARRGNGWELGGNLDLVMPELGLRLDLAARTLLAHSADVDEWGISGGVRWAVRQGGKGLSLAFKPQWGALGSARDALWEHGLSADYNQSQADATGRYSLELTYGLPILHGQDLLTLFTRSNQKANGRDLTLGADLNLGPHFTSGYELLLPQSTTTKPPEHRAFIRYQRAF